MRKQQFLTLTSVNLRYANPQLTDKARKKGKIGGRPKIDPKTIKKIRQLYYEKKETIQYISEKCGVSVGTCYKYIKLSEEEWNKLRS